MTALSFTTFVAVAISAVPGWAFVSTHRRAVFWHVQRDEPPAIRRVVRNVP